MASESQQPAAAPLLESQQPAAAPVQSQQPIDVILHKHFMFNTGVRRNFLWGGKFKIKKKFYAYSIK